MQTKIINVNLSYLQQRQFKVILVGKKLLVFTFIEEERESHNLSSVTSAFCPDQCHAVTILI